MHQLPLIISAWPNAITFGHDWEGYTPMFVISFLVLEPVQVRNRRSAGVTKFQYLALRWSPFETLVAGEVAGAGVVGRLFHVSQMKQTAMTSTTSATMAPSSGLLNSRLGAEASSKAWSKMPAMNDKSDHNRIAYGRARTAERRVVSIELPTPRCR